MYTAPYNYKRFYRIPQVLKTIILCVCGAEQPLHIQFARAALVLRAVCPFGGALAARNGQCSSHMTSSKMLRRLIPVKRATTPPVEKKNNILDYCTDAMGSINNYPSLPVGRQRRLEAVE